MRRMLPPTLFQILLAAIAVLSVMPFGRIIDGAAPGLRGAGVVVFAVGILLMYLAHARFVTRGAEINTFARPRNLVTEGPFRFSRNPMYLAFALMLLGAALAANRWPALVPVAVFLAVCNFHYIPFEERRAAGEFGAAYQAYRARVRRWL